MINEESVRNQMKTKKDKDNLLYAAQMHLPEFEILDREKTLFILPVGSLEVHGRHLVNCADMLAAEVMAEYSGNLFADKHTDWKVIILPLLNIGADELPLPGSINFSRSTVYRALVDYGRALSGWGFRNLVLTTAHGGLAHNLALDDACRTCNRKYGMKMISPGVLVFQDYIYGNKFPEMEKELGRKLSPAEKNSLIDLEHAAGWETSIMLAKRPEWVTPDYKKYGPTNVQLSPFFKKLGQFLDGLIRKLPIVGSMLKNGGVTFDESLRLLKVQHLIYKTQKEKEFSYCGDPSVASAEIGVAWEAALSKDLFSEYENVFISGSKKPNEVLSRHSALFILRHSFIVSLAWIGIAAAIIAIIYIHL
jgi:creatinine amidohydrolase/Fe(II)-dependent formamide hydrolase-like protein